MDDDASASEDELVVVVRRKRRAVAEGLFEPETEWIQGPLY